MFGSYIAYKGKLAGLILDKPFVALYLGGVTRYAWLKKKTLVDKIIDIICDRDGKEGKTSYRKSLYKLLQIEDKEEGEKELDAGEREKVDELLESEERGLIELWVEDKLDLEADENLTGLEKREAEILKTFTIDPLAAGGRVAKDMFEVVMKGFAAVGWDDAGNMLILGKNANPLYVMGKSFTQDVWHLLEGFAGEEDKGIIAPLGGLIIFGIGTHAVFDSYRQMLEEAPRMGYKAKHLLRSLLPFSKEWRYLAWSGLEGYAAPVMKLFQKNKLARIDSYFDELEEAIQSKDGQRVKKICESIKKVAAFEANEVVYRKLSKTRIAWQFNQMIDSIFEQVDKIRAFGTDLDDPEVQKKLQNWLGKAKGELAQTRTVVLNYLTRMNMILGGHPIQAIMKEFPDTSGITQIDAKKFFSGTPQEMSQRISELEGKLSTASVSELERAKASQELLSLKSYLKPESAVEEVAKRVDDLERGLGQISNPEQLKESLERMATDLRAMEEGIQARFVAKVKEARALAEAEDLPLNHPKIQEMLNKIDQEIGIPFAETKMKLVSLLDQGLKMLPKSLRSATLKHKLWRAIEGTEGTFLTRLSQSAGGRAKMMVAMAALMFVTDQLVHRGDPERDLEQIWEELGPDLRQLLLDVLPIAGTYSNFHSAISGKEIISDRDVSSLPDRLSNTAWGVAGLAGDIVTVIGFLPSAGTSTGANIGIRLAKSGAKGQRLMKFLPRLEAVADKMGGYWELAKSLRRIKQAEKTAHAIRALKTIERTAIGSGLVMLGGQIATMVYGFTEGDIEAIDPANYDQESIQGQE
ncbi:MAG: hypothetical protein Q8P95_04620 [bacterium]|nr:hypothetical protein [bacterium]